MHVVIIKVSWHSFITLSVARASSQNVGSARSLQSEVCQEENLHHFMAEEFVKELMHIFPILSVDEIIDSMSGESEG